MRRGNVCLGFAALLMAVSGRMPAADRSPGLSEGDARSVLAVMEQYRRAWLANDENAVLGLFTADAVLMRSDPLDVPTALLVGRGTLRKMRQNLGWAVGGEPPRAGARAVGQMA